MGVYAALEVFEYWSRSHSKQGMPQKEYSICYTTQDMNFAHDWRLDVDMAGRGCYFFILFLLLSYIVYTDQF